MMRRYTIVFPPAEIRCTPNFAKLLVRAHSAQGGASAAAAKAGRTSAPICGILSERPAARRAAHELGPLLASITGVSRAVPQCVADRVRSAADPLADRRTGERRRSRSRASDGEPSAKHARSSSREMDGDEEVRWI
jgi:hypothetical protein